MGAILLEHPLGSTTRLAGLAPPSIGTPVEWSPNLTRKECDMVHGSNHLRDGAEPPNLGASLLGARLIELARLAVCVHLSESAKAVAGTSAPAAPASKTRRTFP